MSLAATSPEAASDEVALFAIHRAELATYLAFAKAHAQIFFSSALRSWVCFDPTTSIGLLRDHRLAVVGTVAPLTAFAERFGCPVPAMIVAGQHIPAMLEGEAHARARRALAVILAEKREALAAAMPAVVERHVRPLRDLSEVDLVADVLAPLSSAIFREILGIGEDDANTRFKGGRIFDRFLSLAAIREAEVSMTTALTAIVAGLGDEALESEAGSRLALSVLGRDTITGTFAVGLVDLIPASAAVRLDAIAYPSFPGDTGVPFVERIVQKDIVLHDTPIPAGGRIRIYLRGLLAEAISDPRQLFGVGHHACLGRQLSLDLWACLIGALATISREARRLEVAIRGRQFLQHPPLHPLKLAFMKQEAIRAKVLELVAERVDEAPPWIGDLAANADADATFVDLQVDSLSTLDLCLALEHTFGLPVDPVHLIRYPSVNAVTRYIADALPADFRLPSGA